MERDQGSTSLSGRQNLTLRHDNRRLTRKTIGYSMFDDAETSAQTFIGFITTLSNHIMRFESGPIPPVAAEVRRKWVSLASAMSAGLTDHVWNFREIVACKPDIMQADLIL